MASESGKDSARLVALTGEAQELHRRLRESIGRASARVTKEIDAGDLTTTVDVLTEVRARAEALYGPESGVQGRE